MTTNYHTAISVGAAANAATFNTPLGQLDAVLGTLNDTVTNAVTGVYNVLDYGAVGDGVTDDTLAIQAAIDASVDGGIVFLPVGRYLVTDSLTAVAYTGHSGLLSTVHICGAGNSSYTDIYGPNYHSTTLWIASAADTPIFELSATRGVYIHDLNILGDDSSEADSCGVWFKTSNSNPLLERVTIGGFAEGIRIGTESTVTGNDDFGTLRNCHLQDLTTCIMNFSGESYGWRLEDSFVYVDCTTVYKTNDNDGAVMNSIKIVRCFLGQTGAVISYQLSGACDARDVAVIEGCTVEGVNVTPILFTQNTGAGNNTNNVVIRDNVISGSDVAALYDANYAAPLVSYYGRGPFLFENNTVNVVRPVFYFDTLFSSSSTYGATLRIATNNFTNRYIIIYPVTTYYPMIYEACNMWTYRTSQAIGGGTNACAIIGQQGVFLAGKQIASPVSVLQEATYTVGSSWAFCTAGTTDSANTENMAYVRIAGTYGSITDVTATLTNGESTATLTAGTAAEKAKIYAGCWITIGASGALLVRDVIGSTIYLHSAYGGATQTTQALDYFAPTIHREFYVNTSGPAGTWAGGDVAWNTSVAAGGSPGWVYVAGTGWKAMANVAG